MPIEAEDLKSKHPFILSRSGKRIGPGYPPPPIEDIAISLGRITRFAGHGLRFHSVLVHSMITAELVPEEARAVALLHDSSEICFSDIPSPFKNQHFKDQEARLLNEILAEHLSLDNYNNYVNNPDIWKLVKIADNEAFIGEIGIIGTAALRNLYKERSPHAEKIVRKYIKKYSFKDCLSSEGAAVIDFIGKVKKYQ